MQHKLVGATDEAETKRATWTRDTKRKNENVQSRIWYSSYACSLCLSLLFSLSLCFYRCAPIDVMAPCSPGPGQEVQTLLVVTLAWRHLERSQYIIIIAEHIWNMGIFIGVHKQTPAGSVQGQPDTMLGFFQEIPYSHQALIASSCHIANKGCWWYCWGEAA